MKIFTTESTEDTEKRTEISEFEMNF